MKIRYHKSNWEANSLSLEEFADRVVSDGYGGVELNLAALGNTEASWLSSILGSRGLEMNALVPLAGGDPASQIADFRSRIPYAKEVGAVRMNLHSGSDFFSFEANAEVLRETTRIAGGEGMPLSHETHRGRALYNLPDTVRYCDAIADLRLTADFSHYMCVHESILDNRQDLMNQLLERVDQIHARIGFQEGPQVPDPMDDHWADLRAHYLEAWWKPALSMAKARGQEVMRITPEAGPPPYMPTLPGSGDPVADTWSVNGSVRDWLAAELGG